MIALTTLSAYITIISCADIFYLNQLTDRTATKSTTYCEVAIVRNDVLAKVEVKDRCNLVVNMCKEKK